MGVFAIMIYVINEGYKVTGSTTCQLHVILLLTLIAGCIDVLFGALNVLAGGVKTLGLYHFVLHAFQFSNFLKRGGL